MHVTKIIAALSALAHEHRPAAFRLLVEAGPERLHHYSEEIRMKRFHVHVAVSELSDSVRFHSSIFGTEPTALRDDCAKWMLEDPRINFAISKRGHATGLDHLGLQVEGDGECATCDPGSKRPMQVWSSSPGMRAAMPNPTSIGSRTRRGSRARRSIPWRGFRLLGKGLPQ